MTENNICELFSKTAVKYKDNIAFNYFEQGWKSITYNELLIKTKGIASYLIKSGVEKGDRVAIISENRPEWCISYLAVSLAGGVAVPLDAQLTSNEIKNLLTDSEPKVVFHSLKTEVDLKKAVKDFVFTNPLRLINFDSPDFRDICKTPDIRNYPAVSGEDVASLIYTSGTTGIPKGVELTHRNFCSDAEAIIKAEIATCSDNVLSILPLHHAYPFMCTFVVPIFLGASVTFPPSMKGPELIATIKDRGVSILVGVPRLLELLRNNIMGKIRQLPFPLPKIITGILRLFGYMRQKTGINPGKLIFNSVHRSFGKRFRFLTSGGAKLDPEVIKDLEALGFTVLEGYGLTETSPVVTFNPARKRKAGSVGKPLPSVEIKIIDPLSRNPLSVMQEGEIVIKGPMVMKGYYKNPQATEESIKDGWFFSGDLGYMDSDSYLFITGRLKEVIVLSSGKTVYPEDVEERYMKIPLIKEICVMGIEEKGLVESLHAVVVPDLEYAKRSQIGNIQEALKRAISDVSLHMPEYMRIKGYSLYLDSLPRTPLGKLRRFMVRDLIKVKGLKKREEDKELMKDKIGQVVIGCITPLLKDKIKIQSTDNLELDLGLDSLARIELAVSLEKAFSINLPETFLSDVQTVGELVLKIKEYGMREVIRAEKTPAWKDILEAEPTFDDKRKVGLYHSPLEWLIICIGLRLVKILMKILFRLKVEGLENIPQKGSYIITPNHTSHLDGFAVIAALPTRLFKNLYSLGFQKYFTGTFRESFARVAHVIPIDAETYLGRALQMTSYVLRNGKSLLIFPEGSRSYNGKLMEFKKGVGILSIELNVPVIPVCIKGSFEALPRGAIWPKFKSIKINFGKPFYPSDLDMSEKQDKYQFFVNELREKVNDLC